MTARQEIMQYLYEFLGSPSDGKASQNIARYMLSTMQCSESIGAKFVLDALLQRIDTLNEALEKHISLNGKPTSIQISADTEEGKMLIKNLMETYKKKGE